MQADPDAGTHRKLRLELAGRVHHLAKGYARGGNAALLRSQPWLAGIRNAQGKHRRARPLDILRRAGLGNGRAGGTRRGSSTTVEW